MSRHRIAAHRATNAFTCLTLVSGILLSGCSSCREEPKPVAPAADPTVVSVGTSSGRFMGSAACKDCHASIYDGWSRSRHHATLRAAGVSTTSKLAGASLADGFAVEPGGAVRGPGPFGGEVRGVAAYVVGGRHREDLWVRLEDGRLQVFPFSFDTDRQVVFEPLRELAGGVPPPPDTVDFWTRLGRSADFTCYGCHATGAILSIAGGTEAGNAIPRTQWAEAGVGCEACHGPGGPHVEAAKAGRASATPPPWAGKGDGAESHVGVCASCHGLRELLRSPFRPSPAEGYGAPLWDGADPVLSFRPDAEFRKPLFTDMRPATYQQEAIALGQSPCVQRGGLTCSHCHDPHSGEPTPSSSGDGACLPCHQEIATQGKSHSRHEPGTPGGRCVDCHMASILRGPASAAARDHTLAPPVAGPGEVPAACARCHDRKEESEKIVAAWNAFETNGKESVRRRSIVSALAEIDQKATSPRPRLVALLEDPTQGWFLRWALATRLQGAFPQKPTHEAAPALVAALGDPNPALRRAALRTLSLEGRPSDLSAIERLVSDPDPYVALEAVGTLGALRDPSHGSRLLAVVSRPDLAGEFRAQLALGRAALLAGEWPRAEEALVRAIELHPFLVNAMNDLGVARLSQQKIEAAQRIWKQALELNPQYEAARRNLDASEGQDVDAPNGGTTRGE